MYARIAFFEGGGPETMEAGRKVLEEKFLPEMKKLQGFAGHLQLADRENRKAASIILFDSEEALRAGDQHLNAMSPPKELGDTRRTSVETYEVAINELSGEAAAARMTRLSGSADRIDESIRFAQESILPQARRMDGWRGVVSLVDRRTGTGALLTFWESAEAMRASEDQADRLRTQTAEGTNQTIAGVEWFEVASMSVPVGAGARQ